MTHNYALYLPTESGEGSALYWLREANSPEYKSIVLTTLQRMTTKMMQRYGYDGDAMPRVVQPVASGQVGVWYNHGERIEAETAEVLSFDALMERCIDHADSLL